MKPAILRRILAAVVLCVSGTAKADLVVGDHVPKLQTGQWIQGEPVTAFDTNHVYIVEFWATWCGPCIGSIPHLNELWQKYKDKGVIVIGQDVWDSDAAVAPFVSKMGTNMTYRVALDDKSRDPDGFMNSNWWKRSVNHHGIPTAFVINRDGVIAWIGHPMALTDQVLNDIISGHYDLARAAADYKTERAEEYKFQDLEDKLYSAIKQKKWNDAASALDAITNSFPKFKDSFAATRLNILLGQKKFGDALQLADSFSHAHSTDDGWQNQLAWEIAISDGPDEPCLALAEKMAERAVELTGGKSADALDTLARVQFMVGKKTEAITTEEKALNVADKQNEKDNMTKTLASYREGKLPDVSE